MRPKEHPRASSCPVDSSLSLMGAMGSLMFLPDPFQRFFEAQCRCLLQSWGDMAIDVKGDTYTGVAQAFAHYLGVDTLPKHQRSVGLAGSMQPIAFESCPGTWSY